LVGIACSDGSGGISPGSGDTTTSTGTSTGTDMTGSMTGTPGAGGGSETTGGSGGSESTGSAGTTVAGTGGMSTTGAGGAGMMTGTDAGMGGAGGAPNTNGLKSGPFKMLVLTKTLEFHHDSIPTALQMLKDLGKSTAPERARNNVPSDSTWTVDVINPCVKAGDPDLDTGQPCTPAPGGYFSEVTADNLKNYEMFYSDNPTGPVFTNAPNGAMEKQIFQDWFTAGGAWAGQHSATDFENQSRWTWFQDNVNGGWFVTHDGDGTPGTVNFEAAYTNHSILKGLTNPWNTSDEWYVMNRNIEGVPGFKILAKVTVSSSQIDKNARPAIWITESPKGARAFYTIRGHNQKVYAEPEFRDLMLRGILWSVHRLP
jgi:type 1 glutamine amidotransferase